MSLSFEQPRRSTGAAKVLKHALHADIGQENFART